MPVFFCQVCDVMDIALHSHLVVDFPTITPHHISASHTLLCRASVAFPFPSQPGQWCENCTSWWLITGVRYAWSESPCCGGNLDTNIIPCPVNSCPISTWNSTLPAVPFSANIVLTNETRKGQGSCSCIPPQKCD
jgi:hypothetical protein